MPRPVRIEHFDALHRGSELLLMPNAWDVGSARMLAQLGFAAIATTSSGSAATVGRFDGRLGPDAALAHAAELAAAVTLPVSADLENGFGETPAEVAEVFERAAGSGLAGASIEDWNGETIDELDRAAERVRAAVEAAAGRLVITARAENHIRGRSDLADTITRLQAYEAAGADVLFAPGLRDARDIERVVGSVTAPVSVLVVLGVPPVATLAELGVRRVSVGGAFAFAAYATLTDAARELREGSYGYLAAARRGGELAAAAFAERDGGGAAARPRGARA